MVMVIFTGCSEINSPKAPAEVVKNFILLCESGKTDEAEKLLAPKNNVDYFYKFKDMNGGRDLIFIDYDYKSNDDTVALHFELLESMSSDEMAVIKMTSNYMKLNSKFEKNIVLYKIDGKWRIHDYLLMPVKVK
jgi:hypothetical protein